MKQGSYSDVIRDQTDRTLWEVSNVLACIPEEMWEKPYCDAPLWKHVYHMLHSLDQWFINPRDEHYTEPTIHRPGLNDLDLDSDTSLGRSEIETYYSQIAARITAFTETLEDDGLLSFPPHCEYTHFTLILAQMRHLHTHMGMIMGFIVAQTGRWPKVLGLEGILPAGPPQEAQFEE